MSEPTWDQLAGTLPVHDDEVMASHQGTPGTGLPAPAPDHGETDQAKYGC
jgi:hypothetical protein